MKGFLFDGDYFNSECGISSFYNCYLSDALN